MPNPTKQAPDPTPHFFSPFAGLLSYLVPGLGQIYQGRVAKGLLFLVCLYGLFFGGMYLGNWSNVYLLDETRLGRIVLVDGTGPDKKPLLELKGSFAAVGHRPQFAGQFWIGVAAWPAIWQYKHYDPQERKATVFGTFEREPDEATLNDLQKSGDKHWDLAWVYTVIAGVLNVLVIYDAFAGPAFGVAESEPTPTEERAT